MASILNATLEGYRILNEDWSYSQVNDFFMMQNPFLLLLLTAFYLLFVYRIGPALMNNRKPFKLDKLLIVYNISQVLFNLFLFCSAMYHLYIPMKYNLFCQEVEQGNSPEDQYIRRMAWVYFMNKIMDLLDTVFFVLKKKSNQISFLHVYHHSGMLFIGYAGVKYVPGGHSILLGTINSFVHVVMYSYYLFSLFKKDKSLDIWWKKYLTQLQLIQFVIVMLHHLSALLLPNCNYPKFVSFMVVAQNVFALFLFGDFYKRAYLDKKQQ